MNYKHHSPGDLRWRDFEWLQAGQNQVDVIWCLNGNFSVFQLWQRFLITGWSYGRFRQGRVTSTASVHGRYFSLCAWKSRTATPTQPDPPFLQTPEILGLRQLFVDDFTNVVCTWGDQPFAWSGTLYQPSNICDRDAYKEGSVCVSGGFSLGECTYLSVFPIGTVNTQICRDVIHHAYARPYIGQYVMISYYRTAAALTTTIDLKIFTSWMIIISRTQLRTWNGHFDHRT